MYPTLDLLLHVVDASNPNFPEQMAEVKRVLDRLLAGSHAVRDHQGRVRAAEPHASARFAHLPVNSSGLSSRARLGGRGNPAKIPDGWPRRCAPR